MESLSLVIIITVAIIVLIVIGSLFIIYQQMKTRNIPGGKHSVRKNNNGEEGEINAPVLSKEWQESKVDTPPEDDRAVSIPEFEKSSPEQGEVIAFSPPGKNGHHKD